MGNEQTCEEQVEMGLRSYSREETKGRKTGNRCRVMQTDTNADMQIQTEKKEKITLVEHKRIMTYNFTYVRSLNHAPVQRRGIGTRQV